MPDGAHRGSGWLCALGILSLHARLALLTSPLCLHVFPERGNAVFLFFVLGSWLKLSLPTHVLCPYCLSCVLKVHPQLKQVSVVRSFLFSL